MTEKLEITKDSVHVMLRRFDLSVAFVAPGIPANGDLPATVVCNNANDELDPEIKVQFQQALWRYRMTWGDFEPDVRAWFTENPDGGSYIHLNPDFVFPTIVKD